ncbi:MAG: hypothetical protein L0191_01390, partial [Acidobacteria bacterium]|nr:hypothetical protein [Acidobacteriota bacterium]
QPELARRIWPLLGRRIRVRKGTDLLEAEGNGRAARRLKKPSDSSIGEIDSPFGEAAGLATSLSNPDPPATLGG